MLITMIFYGSEHIGQRVKISVTINGSIDYKDFCDFMEMLIGSKIVNGNTGEHFPCKLAPDGPVHSRTAA